MGTEPMLFVAGVGGLKVLHCLVADEEFQASIEFGGYFADDTELMYLSYTWLLFEHEVRHVRPVRVDKAVREW